MSLLSYTEICELIEQGVIEGASYDDVNSASLDIHLGPHILQEASGKIGHTISLLKKERLPMNRVSIEEASYHLWPGEFILAQSREIFHLPNDVSAEYKLKSSMARIGLDHLNAGWCDAGWNGSVLTLELKNQTKNFNIELVNGVPIGQLVFFRHTPVPADKSYAARGRYNGHLSVSGVVKKPNEK
jgi:deoxycytidine triphosphate deaminase